MAPIDASMLNMSILATLLFWGAWGIFDKLALRHASPAIVLIGINCLAPIVPIFIYFYIAKLNTLSNISIQVVFWSFLAGLSYFVSMVIYLWVLNKTEASLILGLTSSYPIVLQFFSHLFLGEPLVPIRIVGSVLVFAGIMLIGISAKKLLDVDGNKLSLGIWLAIFAATLLWGVWGVFDKKAIELSGALEVLFCKAIWDVIFLVLLVSFVLVTLSSQNRQTGRWILRNFGTLFNHKPEELSISQTFSAFKNREFLVPVVISSVCLYAGGFSYLYALSKASASYVVVITGCYPLIMYILAILILKERLSSLRLLGILLITLGGSLTQMTQAL